MPTEGYGSYFLLGAVLTFLVLCFFRTITANGEKISKEEFGAFAFIGILWPYYFIKLIIKWGSQIVTYLQKRSRREE